jgi:hypothetical protein
MRSPGRAIAWELGRRHRWGLLAIAGYLLLLGLLNLAILGPGERLDSNRMGVFAATVSVPMTAAAFYLVAVFTFGLSGDVVARPSMYPTRFFRLPVPTAALVNWPMLLGTASIVALWFLARLVAPLPASFNIPLWWPPAFAAVVLAWAQALTWLPYGLPGLRVIVAVLLLFFIDAVVFTAVEWGASEPVMLALMAPLLPLAYLCGRWALGMARRGHVPDWRASWSRLGEGGHVRPRRQRAFPSAAHAQLWLEWRRHGLALPMWVAILLPFEMAVIMVAGTERPRLLFYTLLAVLVTPPFMAAFAAPAGRPDAPGRDAHRISPFVATRPVTTATLVAAKLWMALLSALATWLLVLVAVPLALTWSGGSSAVVTWVRDFAEPFGYARTSVLALVVLAALLASTWKQLVQGLCIGLTGRPWFIKSSVFVRLSLLIVLIPLAERAFTFEGVEAAWRALPWVLAALVTIKTGAAAVVAVLLFRRRLMADRTLISAAAGWTASVLLTYGILVWLVASPEFVPRYGAALVAILLVPLVRPAAVPLALAWNRGR